MRKRDIILLSAMLCIFGIFIIRLGYFQIVKGNEYDKAGQSVSSKIVTLKAARGEILDRNGIPLVVNRQGNSIVFYDSDFPEYSTTPEIQKVRNDEILSLICLFEKHSVKWNNILPLEINSEGKITFKKNEEAELSKFKSKDMLNLNSYATPENCLDALKERYSLQNYGNQDALNIGAVCYGMLRESFNSGNPYTFADDVPEKLVSIIKENSIKYPGVDVEVVTYREYADSSLAPHIIGMVGNISAEEYAEKKDTYSMTDDIGKNGIELALEDELRGEDGYKTIYKDSDGNTTTEYTKNPVQGNSVILTLDSKLQKVAQDALKKCLDSITADIVGTPPAGSVAVVEIGTGNVLAAATYPSYDIATYSEEYSSLVKNEAAPLWNRAFLSTYCPGSTMKPSIALAALSEGVVTKDEAIFCDSTYKYKDITLGCTDAHGSLDVVGAINHSCNIFFYEMGSRLGIDKMNKYREMFGLGEKTGVEIEEAEGVLDSPAYRQSINQVWYPGYVIQSAIGNAGDQFTPLQLANYCATLAGNGKRYKCTLVKSIKTYDFTKTVYESTQKIVESIDINQNYFDLVKRGMLLVGTEGYCAEVFSTLPVKAAAKTGTSQVERTVNGKTVVATNGFVITFAPYDNPQIAICVALEGATSGASVAPVARDIYSYYFKSENQQSDNAPDTLSSDNDGDVISEKTTEDATVEENTAAAKISEGTLLQ